MNSSTPWRYQNDIALIKLSRDVEINGLFLMFFQRPSTYRQCKFYGQLKAIALERQDEGAPIYERQTRQPRQNKMKENNDSVFFLDLILFRFSPFIQPSDFVEPICLPFSTEFNKEPKTQQMVDVAGWVFLILKHPLYHHLISHHISLRHCHNHCFHHF